MEKCSLYIIPPAHSYTALDVRRKNATRESTSTLKAWLYEHMKNPYPTKGEKIMLAIITKMTLTQVSTWFANARRRLKKENKMQWSSNKQPGDHDDDDDDARNGADDDDCDVRLDIDCSDDSRDGEIAMLNSSLSSKFNGRRHFKNSTLNESSNVIIEIECNN